MRREKPEVTSDDATPRPEATGPVPTRGRPRVDLRRLRPADLAVAGGTLLYLIAAILPWYSVDAFDLGYGYRFPAVSANGFDSGLIVVAFVLLVLATGWALMPAVAEVPLPVPRSLLTIGLAALAALLTLIEWLSDLDGGFTAMGLVALLAAGVVLTAAVRRLVSEPGGSSAT
jgi:hypothetical protein